MIRRDSYFSLCGKDKIMSTIPGLCPHLSRAALEPISSILKHAALTTLWVTILWANAGANPYLAKPGERAVTLRIATCAVSGGFVHLYTALDNGLFEKYGFRVEHIYIRGSGASQAALASEQIDFLYCAADATLPGLASGIDVRLVASPLVKLPYVLVTRKDIRRPEDLKGKALGVTRPGDLSARLSRALIKKFNLTTDEVQIRPIGGSQNERYQAMVGDIVQGIVVPPPLDVRAKNDGFNVLYRLINLDLPFVYSSLHAGNKTIRERSQIVQRMVAGFAEAIHFVDKNPDKAKASIGKAMKLKDPEALQVSYDVYAKEIVDRRMIVPAGAIADGVELARAGGTNVRRKPEELYDNRFISHLETSGFLRELWGNELQRPVR